jgi:hypothetical protein
MAVVVVEARLADLADKITLRMRRTVADVVQIGVWLTEAHEICPHGQWEAWLKNAAGISMRMAQHWINIHVLVSKNEKFSLLPPSALVLLSAPSVHPGTLAEITRRLDDGETFTCAQVEEILYKYRTLEGVHLGSETLLATYGKTESGQPVRVIPRSLISSTSRVSQDMLQRGAMDIEGKDHPMPDLRPDVMEQPIPDILPVAFREAVKSETGQRQQQHIADNGYELILARQKAVVAGMVVNGFVTFKLPEVAGLVDMGEVVYVTLERKVARDA